MSKTEQLMKRCQIGDGRWPHAANDLVAECYGRLGWQKNRIRELEESLGFALSWIDAVPSNTVLPTMPGFDRDWVNIVLEGNSNE